LTKRNCHKYTDELNIRNAVAYDLSVNQLKCLTMCNCMLKLKFRRVAVNL